MNNKIKIGSIVTVFIVLVLIVILLIVLISKMNKKGSSTPGTPPTGTPPTGTPPTGTPPTGTPPTGTPTTPTSIVISENGINYYRRPSSRKEKYVAPLFIPPIGEACNTDSNNSQAHFNTDWRPYHSAGKFCWSSAPESLYPEEIHLYEQGDGRRRLIRSHTYLFYPNGLTSHTFVYGDGSKDPRGQKYYSKEEAEQELYLPNGGMGEKVTEFRNAKGESFTDRLVRELWDNEVDIGGEWENKIFSKLKWDVDKKTVVYKRKIQYDNDKYYEIGERVQLGHPLVHGISWKYGGLNMPKVWMVSHNTGLQMFILLGVMKKAGLPKPENVTINYTLGFDGKKS